MEIYKYAAQNRLRFPSNRGQLLAEDLFRLPLTSQDGCNLDTIARAIHDELETMGEKSFVTTAKTDPRKKPLEVALEIVKDVIATKEAAAATAATAAKKKELRGQILEAMEKKRTEAMSQASLEQLEKQLAELGE